VTAFALTIKGLEWDKLPEWISVEEAAQVSGYSLEYVRQMIRAGRIEAKKKGGREWWIDGEKFKSYLQEMMAMDDRRCGPRGGKHID